MANSLASGVAAAFESVVGTPSLDLRNTHKALGIATGEGGVWRGIMGRAYNNGADVTLKVRGVATATSGALKLQVQFEVQTSQDLDADGFATAVAADADPTVSGTSGVPFEATFTLSASEMDTMTAGARFRLKVERLASGNTMTGDFQLLDWEISQ